MREMGKTEADSLGEKLAMKFQKRMGLKRKREDILQRCNELRQKRLKHPELHRLVVGNEEQNQFLEYAHNVRWMHNANERVRHVN